MSRDYLKYRVWDTEKKEYIGDDTDAELRVDGTLLLYRRALGERYVDDDSYDECRHAVERCTGFRDDRDIPIYEKDRIKVEDPIKGIKEDTEYYIGWFYGCWYALGVHGMRRLSELLEKHSVVVLGTVHDKED